MLSLENLPDMLTISSAADILKTTSAVIAKLIVCGQIDHIEIDSNILIPKVLLVDFIEKNRQACYNADVTAPDLFPPAEDRTHLDNCIGSDIVPLSEGETEMAKAKINQPVMIAGEKRWITANSMQEFADKVAKLLIAPHSNSKHPFVEYAWNWFNTYSKPNIETVTATTYKRQIKLYLIPAFDGLFVENITPDDVQRLFNNMSGAKATKDKAKVVLNQILDAAVEDGLLPKNPLKSKRIKIKGAASKETPPYSIEQMRYLVQHISDIRNPVDRMYLAIQAMHPLRLEEVLGLQPNDIDTERMEIHIQRAVTHPTRNQPEIKDTKTGSSTRTISLSAAVLPYLCMDGKRFLFGGDRPLSYTQVRSMCNRIKQDLEFEENITPIRFRTTVLTDLYEQTGDIKLAQKEAGHTTPAMTLKYYVKGRKTSEDAAIAIERAYTAS